MRVAVAITMLLSVACASGPPEQSEVVKLSVAEALGGDTVDGFARATDPRALVFPDDHGPHEEFRTEWWYFTGNLDGEGGAAYGFQLTIFRQALVPEMQGRRSGWASRDIWFAHFAVGDASEGRFLAFERFARGAAGLAGARAQPFAAWVGDWRAESVGETIFPLRLTAAEDDLAIDLIVDSEKPFVLQGDRGLSRKGPEPGNASFYYSATRLTARGSVAIAGAPRAVTGSAWLDREWSTSVLSEGQEGWDWFSIQLDDGRELMLYRLRRADGTIDPFNAGTLVGIDGAVRRFGAGDVRYEPGRRWTSPRTGASYPVEWRLSIESAGIALDVTPLLDASELDVAVRYWEGAIRVEGSEETRPVSGRGFLEMTGYDAPLTVVDASEPGAG